MTRIKPGPPMTLANMRQNGVRAVSATCEACGHKADVNVDALPESVHVPKAGQRLRCSQCGGRTISTRPAWRTARRQGVPDFRPERLRCLNRLRRPALDQPRWAPHEMRLAAWSATMPIDFSDEEKDVLLSLAQPVAFGKRPEFLEKVAEQLANYPHRGPGALHQIARAVQRDFVLTSLRTAAEPRPGLKQESMT